MPHVTTWVDPEACLQQARVQASLNMVALDAHLEAEVVIVVVPVMDDRIVQALGMLHAENHHKAD